MHAAVKVCTAPGRAHYTSPRALWRLCTCFNDARHICKMEHAGSETWEKMTSIYARNCHVSTKLLCNPVSMFNRHDRGNYRGAYVGLLRITSKWTHRISYHMPLAFLEVNLYTWALSTMVLMAVYFPPDFSQTLFFSNCRTICGQIW